MGHLTGFLDFAKEYKETEPVKERIQHFHEFERLLSDRRIITQAARCMDCGIPFCNNACPTHNLIPDFNQAVYERQWEKAYHILTTTNTLPEITGRVCPAPCEHACCSDLVEAPISIKMIELAIIEKAFASGWVKSNINKPTGKKVAVVGSGPAGLTAAIELNQLGHQVTVFEKNEVPGGLAVLGIPNYKLEKQFIARRVKIMEENGIVFKTGVHVGKNYSAAKLRSEFDAVCLTGGAELPRDVSVAGREYGNIHFAMEFLTDQNRRLAKIKQEQEGILATGKNVVVIGGGDTGSDCIGTSVRQGAKSITQLEILPMPPKTRTASNPWPEWANTLRTSTSHEEGCTRVFSCMTQAFKGENNLVSGVEVVDVTWDGRTPVPIENTKRTIPAELVLLAAGFVSPVKEGMLSELALELDQRGNVKTTNYATSQEGVFAAGDMATGASLIVRAIQDAKKMNQVVHQYLQGK